MSKVLVLSSEPVGDRMAGPAIRAFELARALAGAGHAATLAAPAPSALPARVFGQSPTPTAVTLLDAGFADFDRLLAAARDHDVLVAQELPAQLLRHVRRLPIHLVADLYNPRPMEVLEAVRDRSPAAQRRAQALARLTTLAMCAAADFIVCASEKQRDLWLGGLALHGLIALDRYRADPSLRTLIDVVPFGLPATEPQPGGAPVLKGAWPGIGRDDRVLLWGGGIWNWLDAITCIDAVGLLRDLEPPVHLVFQGIARPGLEPVDAISGTPRALAHAEASGLLGQRVHVNHDWVPYLERAAWLLEADLGVSAHHDHLEARFSFRTRVLDYLWAGRPVVGTRGDALADLVEREGLGRTVLPEDPQAFADACRALLDDAGEWEAAAARIAALRPSLTWAEAVHPLAGFCAAPRRREPRRARIAALTAAQYPPMIPETIERHGPVELARKAGRLASRAVRGQRGSPPLPPRSAP
jgi:glycosyltransferase involved in cell wall biosynthesis